MAYFAVDRLEGKYAVVIGDDGTEHEVAWRLLPSGTAESTVLDVSVDGRGRPQWVTAKIDAPERQRRLEQAMKRIEELKREDPGGDIVL